MDFFFALFHWYLEANHIDLNLSIQYQFRINVGTMNPIDTILWNSLDGDPPTARHLYLHRETQRNTESLTYSHCQKTPNILCASCRDSRTDGTPTLLLVNLRCCSTWGLGHASSEARSQICQRLWASSCLSFRPSALNNSRILVGGIKIYRENSSLFKIEQK